MKTCENHGYRNVLVKIADILAWYKLVSVVPADGSRADVALILQPTRLKTSIEMSSVFLPPVCRSSVFENTSCLWFGKADSPPVWRPDCGVR
ncbi:hypothetical protein L1987_72811 [Smallanthus sonchifolius]|uniref:Uncharacterized protein n=1 Tax=Smallanthus sonchifolius TaxID=185202 RepID=A0ACB9AW94_9ASTR|nr:hypothetical protein L1987_72811 [Smallanthus sonchifolius]